VPRGEAELFRRVGSHLAEDITNLGFRSGVASAGGAAGARSGLDRAAFDEACVRLAGAGYILAGGDQVWGAFEEARAAYAGRLGVMAAYWATPANAWLDSSKTLRSPAH
jgi:hypothetical protein